MLFDATELSGYLRYDVSDDAAAIAERVASGWLSSVGVDVTTDPPSEQVFSWAIELGAIAHENPGGLSAETRGGVSTTWSATRRAEILASAGTGVGGAASDRPRGKFPPACPWPDPARIY